jgi:hypothetical protein
MINQSLFFFEMGNTLDTRLVRGLLSPAAPRSTHTTLHRSEGQHKTPLPRAPRRRRSPEVTPVGPPLPPRTSSSSLPACVKWPASFHCVVAGMKTPVRAQRTPGRPGGGPGSGSPGNAGFLVALCGDRRRAEGFSLANFVFDRFVRGLEISWGFDWVARRVGSGPVRQKFYIAKHACAA